MSNGPQFKTGFLAPLPDYGAIGREAAGRFINPILGVVQERAQKQLDKEKMLGIGTAGVTTTPGNINPYYKDGVQKALDVWQQTELDFKQNPSDANAQRVSAAKSQYSSIAQDAVFGSKFILEQNIKIRSDQDLFEQGLRKFNLNVQDAKFGQTPTYEVVGDQVRVVEGGQSVSYFESTVTAANPDNLPVIQGSVESTYKQLSNDVSDTIFVDSYQGRNRAGISENELVDENAFAKDFADQYNGYAKREGTMWNAVALEAYKTKNIPNRGVVEKDLDAVNLIYSPSLKDLNVEGRSITKITGFDADGNPQYDVSEDELKTLVGTEMTTAEGRSFTVTEDNLMKFREAESLHAKNAYERAKSRLSVPEETTTETARELGAAFIPFAPRNYGENNTVQTVEVEEVGQVLDIPTSARLNAVDIENAAVQVENVYMNPEGQVVAYKIGRNRDLLDKLLALPEAQRSEAQQNLIDLLQSGAETITRDDNVELFTELQGQLSRMAAKNKNNPSYTDLIRLGRIQLGSVTPGSPTTPAPTPTPTAAQTALGGLNQGVGAEDPTEGAEGLAVPTNVETGLPTTEPLEITPEGRVVASADPTTPPEPTAAEAAPAAATAVSADVELGDEPSEAAAAVAAFDDATAAVDQARGREIRQARSRASEEQLAALGQEITAEDRLGIAAGELKNVLYNAELDVYRDESDPIAKKYIEEELFADVGFNPRGGASATEHAWSAATVSKLAKAFDPTFEGSSRHSDYIRRGFKGEGNYKAEELVRKTKYQVGDILFKGRKDKDGNPLGPQTYKEFERDAKGKGKYGKERGYGSHSDIIIGVKTVEVKDRKGNPIMGRDGKPKTETVYQVQGGNVGNKLYERDLSASQLRRRYVGRLTQ